VAVLETSAELPAAVLASASSVRIAANNGRREANMDSAPWLWWLFPAGVPAWVPLYRRTPWTEPEEIENALRKALGWTPKVLGELSAPVRPWFNMRR
jgi:hypothetical protein